MTLSRKVEDMKISYSFPNIFPRESPACLYQETTVKNFILTGFKNNSKLRATQMFINRKMNLKKCGIPIEWVSCSDEIGCTVRCNNE